MKVTGQCNKCEGYPPKGLFVPVSFLYLLCICLFLFTLFVSFIPFCTLHLSYFICIFILFFSELQLDPSADQRRKTAKDWKPKYSRDLQQRAKSSSGGSGGNRKWPLFRPKKATNGLDQIKLADSSSAYSEVIFICREFEIREGKMRFQSFSRQKSSALSHIKYLRLRRALHHSPFFYISILKCWMTGVLESHGTTLNSFLSLKTFSVGLE